MGTHGCSGFAGVLYMPVAGDPGAAATTVSRGPQHHGVKNGAGGISTQGRSSLKLLPQEEQVRGGKGRVLLGQGP